MWILSLGVMDMSLVLVLIFWPQRDFMCTYDPASPPAVLETNILSTIGVIIGLHAGDVVRICSFSPGLARPGPARPGPALLVTCGGGEPAAVLIRGCGCDG